VVIRLAPYNLNDKNDKLDVMKAVITADIVNYTKLTNNKADIVLGAMHAMFEELSHTRLNIDNNFSIKRGDSIQIELSDISAALKTALLLKTVVNKIEFDNKKRQAPNVDIRIAIGLGYVDAVRETVNESSGTAYINSGRMLDSMKKNKRLLAIKTDNSNWDPELETEFKLLEVIMAGWKTTSAEVIYLTLLNNKEKEIEEKLAISQSAVNQRKRTAGWYGIEAVLCRFEELVNKEEA
jgi:hypothetical protein